VDRARDDRIQTTNRRVLVVDLGVVNFGELPIVGRGREPGGRTQVRTIRRWLRDVLLRLPGGFGERVVVPRIRRIYERLPLANWRLKRYAASEGRLILSELAYGKNQCTIVYDGVSYGSLVLTLCIARFMIAKGCMTHFVLMHHERTDLDPVATNDFYRDSQLIARRLLCLESGLVSRKTPDDLAAVCDVGANGFLVFDDYTRSGRPWGTATFNLLNWLMAKSPPRVQDKVLYTFADFSKSMPEFRYDQYVAWHCRFSTIDEGRQTNTEEFWKSYTYLQSRFPDHRLLVISDQHGCGHYAKLSKSLGIDGLLFSRDYSTEFMGDVALIMRSEFFYTFRGGGIGSVPLCSTMPYIFIQPVAEEVSWERKRFTSWQNESQDYVKIQKHQFVTDRTQDLAMIPENEKS